MLALSRYVKLGGHSFFRSEPALWNALSGIIRNADSLVKFKAYLFS